MPGDMEIWKLSGDMEIWKLSDILGRINDNR